MRAVIDVIPEVAARDDEGFAGAAWLKDVDGLPTTNDAASTAALFQPKGIR